MPATPSSRSRLASICEALPLVRTRGYRPAIRLDLEGASVEEALLLQSLEARRVDQLARFDWLWRYFECAFVLRRRGTIDCALAQRVENELARVRAETTPIYAPRQEHKIAYYSELREVRAKQSRGKLVGGAVYPIECVIVRSKTASLDSRGQEHIRRGQQLEVRLYEPPKEGKRDEPRELKRLLTWREGRDDPQALLDLLLPPHVPDLEQERPRALEAARKAVQEVEAEHQFELADWQREDIARAVVTGRVMLAWAQGGGKSLGSIVFQLACEKLGAPKLALFIVPQDLVPQWREEAKRFGQTFIGIDSPATVLRMQGEVREGYRRHGSVLSRTPRDVRDSVRGGERSWFITHYEVLSRSGRARDEAGDIIGKSGYAQLKSVFRDASVIVDEVTKLKGGESAVGLAIRALKARRRLVLTGTPIKNRLPDLFWLLWWVGGNASRRFPYSAQEAKDFLRDYGVREAVTRADGKKVVRWRAEASSLLRLRRLLAPLIIRRTAVDVFSSRLRYRVVPTTVPFGKDQRRFYLAWLERERFVTWWRATHPKADPNAAAIAQLSHLEYASTCPAAERHIEYAGRGSNWTPKSLRVLETIATSVRAGRRVLFGSPSLAYVAWIVDQLKAAGIPALSLVQPKTKGVGYCSLFPAERGRLVRQFAHSSSGPRVLAAGMGALALGHNLDTVEDVVVAGLPWDMATYEQFLARVRRFSSKGEVTMHVVMTEGSLDERKWELLGEKRSMASNVVDGQELLDDDEQLDLATILMELQRRGVPSHESAVDEGEVEAAWQRSVAEPPPTPATSPQERVLRLSEWTLRGESTQPYAEVAYGSLGRPGGRPVLDRPALAFRRVLGVAAALTSGYEVPCWEGHRAALDQASGRFGFWRRAAARPEVLGSAFDAARALVAAVGRRGAGRALRLARMSPAQRHAVLAWWEGESHAWALDQLDWWKTETHEWTLKEGEEESER